MAESKSAALPLGYAPKLQFGHSQAVYPLQVYENPFSVLNMKKPPEKGGFLTSLREIHFFSS
jgi:hypothetical protein